MPPRDGGTTQTTDNSMIKYKVRLGRYPQPEIQAVECERETDSSVWVKYAFWGDKLRRHAKRSDTENYFDTWEEAHAALLDAARRSLANAKHALKLAKDRYDYISDMVYSQPAPNNQSETCEK